jgi:hypothetical protein
MVYEYKGMTADTLLEVEKETSQIFRKSGIGIDWILCRTAETIQECPNPTPSSPAVRMVSRFQLVKDRVHRETMGYATGNFATVSVDFAQDLEKLGMGRTPEILAHVIAHELGHVLLPGPAHAVSGIMRANWNTTDWTLIQQKRLNFTTEQARFLRAELSDR